MIYSAICGGIDPPRSDVKCFTDMGPFADPRWAAKRFKILSHLFIDDAVSVWVDGNIIPLVPEAEIVSALLPNDAEIAVFRHPYRNTITDEINELIICDIESKERMRDFLHGIPRAWLALPLYECGFIVRRNTPEVAEMNNFWWSLITRFSVRDQITFPIAVFNRKVKLHTVEADMRNHPMLKYTYH